MLAANKLHGKVYGIVKELPDKKEKQYHHQRPFNITNETINVDLGGNKE